MERQKGRAKGLISAGVDVCEERGQIHQTLILLNAALLIIGYTVGNHASHNIKGSKVHSTSLGGI
jgi:hypothetical protein